MLDIRATAARRTSVPDPSRTAVRRRSGSWALLALTLAARGFDAAPKERSRTASPLPERDDARDAAPRASARSSAFGTSSEAAPRRPVDHAPASVESTRPDADESRGRMEALPGELLEAPIKLEGCPGVEVVEWRATRGLEESTEPNEATVWMLGRICRHAFRRFPRFLERRRMRVPSLDATLAVGVRVGLMPWERGRGGEAFRNLNDVDFRFRERGAERGGAGEALEVWGYYQLRGPNIYLRNDVLTPEGNPSRVFVRVFAHELWHWLSFSTAIQDRTPGTREQRRETEEWMASAFGRDVDRTLDLAEEGAP